MIVPPFWMFFKNIRLSDIKKIKVIDLLSSLIVFGITLAVAIFILNEIAEPYYLCESQDNIGNITLDNFCPFGDYFLGCKPYIIIECEKLDESVGIAINQIKSGLLGE